MATFFVSYLYTLSGAALFVLIREDPGRAPPLSASTHARAQRGQRERFPLFVLFGSPFGPPDLLHLHCLIRYSLSLPLLLLSARWRRPDWRDPSSARLLVPPRFVPLLFDTDLSSKF